MKSTGPLLQLTRVCSLPISAGQHECICLTFYNLQHRALSFLNIPAAEHSPLCHTVSFSHFPRFVLTEPHPGGDVEGISPCWWRRL